MFHDRASTAKSARLVVGVSACDLPKAKNSDVFIPDPVADRTSKPVVQCRVASASGNQRALRSVSEYDPQAG